MAMQLPDIPGAGFQPTLSGYVRGKLPKGEVSTFTDCARVLCEWTSPPFHAITSSCCGRRRPASRSPEPELSTAQPCAWTLLDPAEPVAPCPLALPAASAKFSSPESVKEVAAKVLPRIAQFGNVPPAILPVLVALKKLPEDKKTERKLLRLVNYFVQLLAGEGTAGSVVPFHASQHGQLVESAVGQFGPDQLEQAWTDATVDFMPHYKRTAALRALAALARSAFVVQPGDTTYMGGLFQIVSAGCGHPARPQRAPGEGPRQAGRPLQWRSRPGRCPGWQTQSCCNVASARLSALQVTTVIDKSSTKTSGRALGKRRGKEERALLVQYGLQTAALAAARAGLPRPVLTTKMAVRAFNGGWCNAGTPARWPGAGAGCTTRSCCSLTGPQPHEPGGKRHGASIQSTSAPNICSQPAAITCPDPLGARHALAITALVAHEKPQAYANRLGPTLQHNLELFQKTGSLTGWGHGPRPRHLEAAHKDQNQGPKARPTCHAGLGKQGCTWVDPRLHSQRAAACLSRVPPPTPASTDKGSKSAAADKPAERMDDPDAINLHDTWSRVYLARGCGAMVQVGRLPVAAPLTGPADVL
jgi:hypothetical protein